MFFFSYFLFSLFRQLIFSIFILWIALCDVYKNRVSLRIPVSNLCVCVCVLCVLLNKMEDAKLPHLLLKDLAFFHYDMIESTRN